LEKLRGDREGQWSVRINQQYRVCFSFERGYAYDVDLEPLSMTAYQLAKAIGVMPPRVYEIVRGERVVSALRLGRYFGTGPEIWLNLQSHHDLEVARDRAVEKAGDKAALAGVAGAEIAL
jgi:addiction module HigA family antidote